MKVEGELDGDVMVEIGVKIKQLRKGRRYSQQELADRVGVSRRLIIDIEAGRGTSILVFVKILKEFKKTDKLLEILSASSISPKDMFNRANK